ncbi:MAG: hypothetical protein IJE43_02970 [Alphaproteobacteria bacterium]|nr:hypothetical protein [Alphaproteobacteria bacterium]MBQ6886273.1 hypothetical protein [Lachnospiraceae bacterium]
MMREKIEKFCNDIKEEYFMYLYNKGESINFPYCCKLSADLITSFFKMVCSNNFKYMCTTRERAYNHAWTYYNDGKEEFIIDFTNLQYTNDNIKHIERSEVSVEKFRQIVSKEQVVFSPEETYMYLVYELMHPKEQKCNGILEDFEGVLNKDCFMEYLEINYDNVFENTNYY